MKSSDAPVDPDIRKSSFIFFSAVILILAADLRLCLLWLKPFHNDEGVNAHFLLELLRHGKYAYDPENYHGPFIYFFTVLLVKLFGFSDFVLRLSPVLFSVAQLTLLFCLKNRLKKPGVLTALVLMGFSPNIIYFSRTFIHEIYFTAATLALFVSIYYLCEKRNTRFLIPAALSMALLITIKETFVITLACLSAAGAVSWLARRRDAPPGRKSIKLPDAVDAAILAIYAGLGLCVFLLIYLLLYSSFFQNPSGPWAAGESLFHWRDRSRYDHVKGFLYYFKIILQFELPVLALTLFGLARAVQKRGFFLLFLSGWTVLTFLAYSLIPYKTPWLVLNILLPAILTAGAAVGDAAGIWITTKTGQRIFAVVLWILIAGGGIRSAEVNFLRYDDDALPMVYVQTHRSYRNFFPIWNVFRAKYGDETKTAIFSPSYWPLPWDLRDHKTVGYYAKLTPGLEDHPFLITEDTQHVETKKIYGVTHHKLEMPFALRPGFNLYLWIRKDMWEDTFGDENWRPISPQP
ncbi:MAG: TIGR03663 family protein [Candidatus Omnitrophica bacterium]|nr:TIGR03663 family protein [Candidatus Omnitrophota bacterium]